VRKGGDVCCRVVPGRSPARLDRGDDQALIGQGDARDMRSLGEGIVDRFFARGRIGGRARPVDRDIAGDVAMHLRRAGLHGLADISDGGQGIVINIDQLRAVERGKLAFRDDRDHRLADMRHLLARERRPMRHRERFAVAGARNRWVIGNADDAGFLDIGGGQHRDHAGRGFRRFDIDRRDARGGMRRAHEGGVQHARLRRIGNVAAASGDQRLVFDARKRRMGARSRSH
jgi:hypothetical protein